MMYYIINAIMGAAVATLIAFIGRSNIYVLAGLIPLFPTFTLFAHISAFQNGGVEQLKPVILFGLLSIIPYLIYVAVMYFSVQQGLKISQSIGLSIVTWLIAAGNIFLLAKKYLGI